MVAANRELKPRLLGPCDVAHEPIGPRLLGHHRVAEARHELLVAPADATSCLPSANSSTILSQNAGRSSGLREVTSPWSTTTSSSTQLPPALRMSVCSDGQEVIV